MAEKGKFDQFLEELNISRKKFFLIVGGFFLFIAVFTIGILWFLGYLQPKEERPKEEETQLTDEEKRGMTQSVSVPLLIGQPVIPEKLALGPTGISEVLFLGTPEIFSTAFGKYVTVIQKMKNAFETDIHALLQNSTDRVAALEQYIELLKSLENEGKTSAVELSQKMGGFQQKVNELDQRQLARQREFFAALEKPDPVTSEKLLSEFIAEEKQLVDFKARTQALQRVARLYQSIFPRFAARIRALELNREPLVAGIRVYEVSGADLDLVITVEE